MAKKLAQLMQSVQTISVHGNMENEISLLTYDSRNVTADAVFFAIKGTQVDGHNYITNVIEKGCKAIVCEVLPAELNTEITFIQVSNTSESMALMAAEFYNHPSKKLILVAVTGTN